jgi:hypothetical protein
VQLYYVGSYMSRLKTKLITKLVSDSYIVNFMHCFPSVQISLKSLIHICSFNAIVLYTFTLLIVYINFMLEYRSEDNYCIYNEQSDNYHSNYSTKVSRVIFPVIKVQRCLILSNRHSSEAPSAQPFCLI